MRAQAHMQRAVAGIDRTVSQGIEPAQGGQTISGVYLWDGGTAVVVDDRRATPRPFVGVPSRDCLFDLVA